LVGAAVNGKLCYYFPSQCRALSDLAQFRRRLEKSRHLVILTGAGVSAESGVPTFRGSGGLWRTYQATDLATPSAFDADPSLVWQFYHYRRELVQTKKPNAAHIAIAQCEHRWAAEGRRVVVITQNVDELHLRAGSNNVLQLHGSLFQTRCTACHHVQANYDSPICGALKGLGAPEPTTHEPTIPVSDLPKCRQPNCLDKDGGLLRPHIVWFGESLDESVLRRAYAELEECDLCVVVGTSAVVYPAAMFAPLVMERGVSVAEFNLEQTPLTGSHRHIPAQQETCTDSDNATFFYFPGACAKTVPQALAP